MWRRVFGDEEITKLLIVDLRRSAVFPETGGARLTSTYVAFSCQFLLLDDLCAKFAALRPDKREGARIPEARPFGPSSFSKRMPAARGTMPAHMVSVHSAFLQRHSVCSKRAHPLSLRRSARAGLWCPLCTTCPRRTGHRQGWRHCSPARRR